MIMANMKNTIRIVLAGIVLALACVGCADRMVQFSKETYSKVLDKLPKKHQPCYVHTVQWPSETFSIIAKWYTGKIENSDILVRANTRLDPNRLSVGTKVLIPEDIMITTAAMPKSFVDSLTSETEESAHAYQPPSPLEEEDEFKVFGPKDH